VTELERTLAEALELGHNYIGTEHIVLGLHHTEEGLAGKVLRKKGVERDALKGAIVKRLTAA
jgi:ATP-dependent Clp protease ATP-binding subunit ClpC